jgi:IMP dehydrogenase/GMP reductase
MAKILKTKSIYYNDVNLLASIGKVESRKDIPNEKSRIFVSPMPAVVGKTFANKASELGLSVCLHRFCNPYEQASIYNSILNKENTFMSCGLKNDTETYKVIADTNCKNIVVDFANGYLPNIANELDNITNYLNIRKLIIGNVHTAEGVEYLENIVKQFQEIEELYIRVGIAGGGPCATSDVTGINRGNITEIIECSNAAKYAKIIADGGIHKAGSACKAFAAGAHGIFMGKYWMQSFEAESNLSGDGSYWGCASHKNQENWKGAKFRHSEGKVVKEDFQIKNLEEVVGELWGGITSYVSYAGYTNLSDAIGNGVFELKQNSLPPKNR